MSPKQKVLLVAAQYARVALEMTDMAGQINALAQHVDDDKARDILATMQAEGLIDGDGIITEHATAMAAGGSAGIVPN